MANKNVEYRIASNGAVNKNYVDMLEEDKPIAGQKFACISFISGTLRCPGSSKIKRFQQ